MTHVRYKYSRRQTLVAHYKHRFEVCHLVFLDSAAQPVSVCFNRLLSLENTALNTSDCFTVSQFHQKQDFSTSLGQIYGGAVDPSGCVTIFMDRLQIIDEKFQCFSLLAQLSKPLILLSCSYSDTPHHLYMNIRWGSAKRRLPKGRNIQRTGQLHERLVTLEESWLKW